MASLGYTSLIFFFISLIFCVTEVEAWLEFPPFESESGVWLWFYYIEQAFWFPFVLAQRF